MANKNKNLNDAAKAKKDEFYTQLEDIERELNHEEYTNFFKGKTILCNCDDPYESEFFKYFAMNFNALEIKKLIVTCYAGSPVAQTELNFDEGGALDKKHRNEYAYKVIITELKDWNGDGREDLKDIKQYILTHNGCWERLKGNGDFRSAECIELLREADVVVTNPPFSLFREYVAQLMQYNKKFAIIGNINSITYKEIFPLIQQNKIWLGYGFKGMVGFFSGPYEDYAAASQHREGLIRNSGVIWYTNIPLKKHKEEILLVQEYTPEKYPHYDNYDAIEVSKTAAIPCDYFGVMGVPITFLDKYNPAQFEILGMTENLDLYGLKTKIYTAKECRDQYFKLFGKKGTYDLNAAGVVNGKKVYQRILIRRRQEANSN